MSSAKSGRPAKRRTGIVPAMIPAHTLTKLEVIEIRLRRARHVVNCIEFAATAEAAEVELGPVTFVAVDLIDQVLDDLAAIMSSGAT